MTKFNEKLEEFFDIIPTSNPTEIIPTEESEKLPISLETLEKDFKEDYQKVRDNFHDLIELGKDAIEDMLNIAKESEKARDFEVAANILKNVLDANDQLIEIHRKIREISNYKQKTVNNTEIKNTLFVGSTSELSKLLKDINDNNIIDIDQ